jgi:response regulator RpfG family c-di-GMP phosphodiesterase
VETLEIALTNALKQYRLIVAEKELLEQTLNGVIKVLTEVLSITDPHAFGRAQRLRDEMKTLASWFGAARAWELELGAMLSLIGYVAIPAKLLVKVRSGAPLSGAEKDMLARTPEGGASLLEKIPRLGNVAEIVRYQHKNFDGSGFPNDGVSGDAIPIGARILRVLNDLLDAEAHNPRMQAFARLRNANGLYDPKVLEAIAACYDVYLDKPSTAVAAISVTVSELKVGAVFTEDVRTKEGTLLVTANTRLSPALLQKLRNFHELTGLEEPLFIRQV